MSDIQSAAQLLGKLLVQEAQYLYKVDEEVKELQDELDWMQCFLRDADASQYDNAMARRWVARIREYAYEAEDTIERFLTKVVIKDRGQRDFWSMMKKFINILWEARLVYLIRHDIDDLKKKISNLTSKLHSYDINLKMGEGSSSLLSRLREMGETYTHDKKQKIIKREHEDVLFNQLTTQEGTKTRVISIYGPGGVGKTFLANKIFYDPKIRKEFEAFAWAYVSQPCQSSSVQQDVLSNLTSKPKEQINQMTDAELKDELCKIQCRKKCIIVLDGIWEKQVWDSLKEAFPVTSQHCRSKLLITNRLLDVAKHVHEDAYTHELKCLRKSDSNLLLQKKIKVPCGQDHEENKKLKKKLVDNCEGLPLVISVLREVLAKKKTEGDWKDLRKSINSYLVKDDEHVPRWKRILELSYHDLPYQLKPSFLYLGYFPTNLEISTKKIIRLWEAEGLVPSGDDELSEDTVENVAECCLGELIRRSLVQVGSRGLTGKVKTCIVHDLMRELCMTKTKASEGSLLSIVQLGVDQEDQPPSGTSSKIPKSSKSAKKKFRRLAIYYSSTTTKLPSDYRHAKYIRSLLFFNTLKDKDVLIPIKSELLKQAFKDYKLLRVLDIENIDVPSLPSEVGDLIHLRYLSLKGSWVSRLPPTIGNLRCLQTLDLRVLSFVHMSIPDVLWRMIRLIHLYLPSTFFVFLNHAGKLRLKGLKNLERLSNFSNENCRAEDVGELYNLRSFSSCDPLSDNKCIEPLLGSPDSKLVHLEKVSLKLEGKILEDKSQILSSCKKLRKLWVIQEINRGLTSGMLPDSLIRLSFHASKFKSDPMQVLGKLPCLKKLSLKHDSYLGTAMECTKGGFPELEYLTLKGLKYLQDWTIEEGAMPKLCHLKINDCQNLKTIPQGMKSLKKLRELEISFMPFSFFERKSPNEWVDFPKVKDVVPLARINISNVLENVMSLSE